MKNLIEKILFIKPFEIESSYSSFIVIWKNINKVLSRANGIYTSALLSSIDCTSKYGFVSFSAWESKSSFLKAANDNAVLKYHISKNREEKESDYLYLYRVIKNDILESRKNANEILIINFIKEKKQNEKNVVKYWKEITELYKRENFILNSYLCKSIYQISKFGYIIFMGVKNIEKSYLLNNHLLKMINPNKIKKSYLSIYNRNLKKNNL
jgi:hypothetical protein